VKTRSGVPKIGAVTIGQSPRVDIVPEFRAAAGLELEIVERGALDGLSPDEIRTLAPGRGSIERTPGRENMEGTAEEGFVYCGPSGAGHYVKMVHNGIEYGVMQAYAEGFDLLRNAGSKEVSDEYRYEFNLADMAEVWRRGSVIGSWLLDLTAAALADDQNLEEFSGHVQDSGEGRWALMAAIESATPADVLSAALYRRFRSRKDNTFAEKVLSAMRFQFGGHRESTGT